jgi:myo-inositol-hexaphosphate 3-phosphohydrolase
MKKYIIILIIAATCFSLGRYTAPKPKVEEHKTQDVITHETIVVVKRPDGTTESTTTVDSHSKSDTSKIIIPTKISTLTVYGLAGVDTTSRLLKPIYGVEVSKQIIGSIRLGAFGMTNGVVGLTIGMDF